jgi:E3 ubiquitin-protein ligase NEDD4
LTLDLKKSNNNESVSGKLIINASTNVNMPIVDPNASSHRGLPVEHDDGNAGASSSSSAAGVAILPKPTISSSRSGSNLPSNEDHLGPLPQKYLNYF